MGQGDGKGMSDAIKLFRVNAFRVDRHYQESMFRSAMIAAELWATHSDPYAIAARDYWLSVAIGWTSR